MSQSHTPPSRPVGPAPRIRRAVRTSGPVDPSRPVATVRTAGPSLSLRRPSPEATAPEPPEVYSPFKVDRPPTRAEIAVWHDDFIADARAKVAAGDDGGHPMYFHHAEVGADRVGSDWHALLDRVEAEGIEAPLAGKMAGRILVDAMTGLPRADVATMDVPAPVDTAALLAEASVPDPVVAWKAEQDREAAQRADAVERAIDATATASVADGGEVDANERDRRLVDAGIRFEQARLQAAAAGKDQKAHRTAQDGAMRELLEGFVDSGQASLSLIMPDSGENRVLTPYQKVWPKVRPLTDPATQRPVLDESDNPVLASTAARIAAIKAAGLADELLEVKINSTALNEMFEGFASETDMPEALRAVYELSTEWKMSSTKGGRGRSRTPTAAEVANGRRAGSGE